MKNIFLIFAILSSSLSKAQHNYLTREDIKDAKQIIFFGYDFSHFKLADAKRINDKTITSFPPAWVGYLNKLKNEGYYADKLDTKKVIFHFSYAEIIIRNLKNEDIASLTKQPIPIDSIQPIINRYQTHFNEGIGFTIIVEYFDKMSNTSSAYFTFFDIASKKIIMNRNYSTSNNTQGYGMTKYWGNSLSETIFNYFERFYKKDLKAK